MNPLNGNDSVNSRQNLIATLVRLCWEYPVLQSVSGFGRANSFHGIAVWLALSGATAFPTVNEVRVLGRKSTIRVMS